MYLKILAEKVLGKMNSLLRQLRSADKYYDALEQAAAVFPKYVSVALTNICNSNCIFCAYKYRTYKPAVIDDALLDKIAREFSELGGGMIGISVGLGDPLADPEYWKHLEIIRKYKNLSVVAMFSNFIGAKKLGPERLALEGPQYFCVSIGGFDRETYKRVFCVDHFDEVMESLLILLETRKKAGIPLGVQVMCRSNIPWHKHLNSPHLKKLLQYIDSKDIIFQSRHYDNWGGLIQQKDLLPGMGMDKNGKHKKYPCVRLYDCLGILPDGTAVACSCREANADSALVVGNIKTSSMLELGTKVAQIRSQWRKGEIPPICQRCSAYYATLLSLGDPTILKELRERQQLIAAATKAM